MSNTDADRDLPPLVPARMLNEFPYLEENGSVSEGVLYFVSAKRRVSVPIDAALRARTLDLLSELRRAASAGVIPPPLRDSPNAGKPADEIYLLTEGEVSVVIELAGGQAKRIATLGNLLRHVAEMVALLTAEVTALLEEEGVEG